MLGAVGAYIASRALSSSQTKRSSSEKGKSVQTSETILEEPVDGDAPEDREFLQDPDTGEFFVVENGREPRLISEEEMYELTGGAFPIDDGAEAGQEFQENNNENIHEADPNRHQPVIGLEDYEGIADDEFVDAELEFANQQIPVDDAMGGGGEPGPATAARTQRFVGTKKAKSLERKDQKKRYNEYIRTMAMLDRQDQEKYEAEHANEIREQAEARREQEALAEEEKRAKLAEQKQKEAEEKQALEAMKQRLSEVANGSTYRIETEQEREVARGMGFLVDEEQFLFKVGSDEIKKLADAIRQEGKASFDQLATVMTKSFA